MSGSGTGEVRIDTLPMPLRWLGDPAGWSADGSRLTIEAGAKTDWFADPASSGRPVLNAPALLGEASGDYLLRARVEVGFRATFDAGALVAWAGPDRWGKLAFELSPQGEPTIVSVVTRGRSDDANAFAVAEPSVWLRIARLGPAFAFHASADGEDWRLVRLFSLGEGDEPAVGFEAQSPTGAGCAAVFDGIRFERGRLEDLRDGS
jgi:regulation of enolase protein 1 (concanavalin A-like superfamily)